MCTKITVLTDLEEDGISAVLGKITHSAVCKAPKVIFQLNIVILSSLFYVYINWNINRYFDNI